MNADPQLRPAVWDDEIDLRQLIETLLQRKWMIAGVVVVAAFVAAIYSTFVVSPRYETSIVIALPDEAASDSLGMGTKAYEVFALSNRVLQAMYRNGDLNVESPGAIQKRLNLKVDKDSRLFTVTTHAATAAEAEQLAWVWQQAFQAELLAHMRTSFGRRLQQAEINLDRADSAARTATARQAEYERLHSSELKEARLLRWEEELIRIEARLQELTEHLLPTDGARVSFLEDALREVSPTVDRGNVALVGSGTDAAVLTNEVTILNPIHLELTRDLNRTRTRLAANEYEAGLLRARLNELPEQVSALRAEVVALRAERSRLDNEVAAANRRLDEIRDTVQHLSGMVNDLEQLTALATIAEPTQPAAPVAPRKLLNVALAAFLGGFVAVGAAFFQHFWDDKPRD